VEIIQDLRKGVFDVLVGINLLREGLDIPEVSLVAIFDADKEGFLRSDRSLIQTIGRAARNLNGKAILYADKVTGSMSRAIEETERRREKQQAYNKEHNITPQSVEKSVGNIMEGAQSRYDQQRYRHLHEIAEHAENYEALTPELALKQIQQLEQKMYEFARNLEFEDAARTRDEIQRLKNFALGKPEVEAS
jgi:excinuclease ABC subunit B